MLCQPGNFRAEYRLGRFSMRRHPFPRRSEASWYQICAAGPGKTGPGRSPARRRPGNWSICPPPANKRAGCPVYLPGYGDRGDLASVFGLGIGQRSYAGKAEYNLFARNFDARENVPDHLDKVIHFIFCAAGQSRGFRWPGRMYRS